MRYLLAYSIVSTVAAMLLLPLPALSFAGSNFTDGMQPALVIPFKLGEGRSSEIVPNPNIRDDFTINDMKLGDPLASVNRKMMEKYPNARYAGQETQYYLTNFDKGIRVSTQSFTYYMTFINENSGITDQTSFLFSPPSSNSRTLGIERSIAYSRESGWGDLDDLKKQILGKWGKPDRVQETSSSLEYEYFRDKNGAISTYNRDCDKIVNIAETLLHADYIIDNLLRLNDDAYKATKSGCWSVLRVKVDLDAGHVRAARFMTYDNFMFGLSTVEQGGRVADALKKYVDDMQNKKATSPKL